MLVPIINIYVHNTIYYTSYLGFCPWHPSLKPAGPWDFPFRIVSIVVFHPFSWPLNLLLVVCGEVEDCGVTLSHAGEIALHSGLWKPVVIPGDIRLK